jgi:hypothetical protein
VCCAAQVLHGLTSRRTNTEEADQPVRPSSCAGRGVEQPDATVTGSLRRAVFPAAVLERILDHRSSAWSQFGVLRATHERERDAPANHHGPLTLLAWR